VNECRAMRAATGRSGAAALPRQGSERAAGCCRAAWQKGRIGVAERSGYAFAAVLRKMSSRTYSQCWQAPKRVMSLRAAAGRYDSGRWNWSRQSACAVGASAAVAIVDSRHHLCCMVLLLLWSVPARLNAIGSGGPPPSPALQAVFARGSVSARWGQAAREEGAWGHRCTQAKVMAEQAEFTIVGQGRAGEVSLPPR